MPNSVASRSQGVYAYTCLCVRVSVRFSALPSDEGLPVPSIEGLAIPRVQLPRDDARPLGSLAGYFGGILFLPRVADILAN